MDVANQQYPSQSTILQNILNAFVFAYVSQGLPPPNVLPESDHYERAKAYAARVAILVANNQWSEAQGNPLTSVGADLAALAGLFGVQARPAAPAAGGVVIVVTGGGAVNLPSGFLGSTPDGQQYQTTQTYSGIATGATVEVIALAPGASSKQAAGTKLTWSSAAIGFLGPVATVGSAGLVGGADTDNDDTLRARLLEQLSAPAVGGNWSSVVQWAENASSSVEHAYCYEKARGWGSYDVALTAPGGSPSGSFSGRQLPQPTLDIVRAGIVAQMPGQQDLLVTSITDQFALVVMAMSLPLPESAGDVGGGWLDPSPWPAERTKITGYNSGTGAITVNSVNPPIVGNNIGIWSPGLFGSAGPAMMTFSVTGPITGSAGAWTFFVQGGIGSLAPAMASGLYVSAGALNLVQYAATFATSMYGLGPGQITSLPELLPAAQREPSTSSNNAARSEISTRLTTALQVAYPEIIDVSFDAVFDFVLGIQAPPYVPAVPANSALPPNLWTPLSIAFWAQAAA